MYPLIEFTNKKTKRPLCVRADWIGIVEDHPRGGSTLHVAVPGRPIVEVFVINEDTEYVRRIVNDVLKRILTNDVKYGF